MPKSRKKGLPSTEWKLVVPAHISAEIEELLWDKVHQKPHYGARSQLVVVLLERYLTSVRAGGPLLVELSHG